MKMRKRFERDYAISWIFVGWNIYSLFDIGWKIATVKPVSRVEYIGFVAVVFITCLLFTALIKSRKAHDHLMMSASLYAGVATAKALIEVCTGKETSETEIKKIYLVHKKEIEDGDSQSSSK